MTFSKIPSKSHYAIITTSTVYHDGGERSRTNPGHGYPVYSEEVINYEAFEELEDFEAEVANLIAYGKTPGVDFKLIQSNVLRVKAKPVEFEIV